MELLSTLIPCEWQNFLLLSGRIALALVLLIVCVAYLTYVERKIIAAVHLRRGPNVVGLFGLLQPFADAIKLLHKETIFPTQAKKGLFLLAPILTFVLSFMAWAVIPIGQRLVFSDISVGILAILALSSLAVYGLLMAGWASQSTYGILGALRSAAQMISYEVSLSLVIVSVLLWTGTLNLTKIVEAQKDLWFVIPLFPMFIVFLIGIFAETNRAPFDLPEAEAELVAGYHVEYSSMPFALFFLAEYANMMLMSALTTILFLGGWLPPIDALDWVPAPFWFFLKMSLILFLFVMVRATFPRFRYDQLMTIGWKVLLPFSLGWVILTAGLLLMTGQLPKTMI
ncbi:MAG: NADH-quinone oxidoreductase subunit NuoH [Alphaproteobacteria bacterium]|nr:NADH-quinone oxidoreductase subunit NuoH [Alphaproteobacteria bacterium]